MHGMTIRQLKILAAAVMFSLSGVSALGDVDLEVRPTIDFAIPGDTIGFELYAISTGGLNEAFPALEVVFEWSTSTLELMGVEEGDGISWSFNGLPMNDPYGLNESVPPADGDGLFIAGTIGTPPQATPEGILVSTFYYTVLNSDGPAYMEPLVSGGYPETDTIVYSSTIPNLSILGGVEGAEVTVVPEPVSLVMLLAGGVVVFRRGRNKLE